MPRSRTGFDPQTPINRAIFRLLDQGLRQRAISEELGVKFGTVRDVIYRARLAGFLSPPVKPLSKAADPNGAWRRIARELEEIHRREALTDYRVEPWAQRADFEGMAG